MFHQQIYFRTYTDVRGLSYRGISLYWLSLTIKSFSPFILILYFSKLQTLLLYFSSNSKVSFFFNNKYFIFMSLIVNSLYVLLPINLFCIVETFNSGYAWYKLQEIQYNTKLAMVEDIYVFISIILLIFDVDFL